MNSKFFIGLMAAIMSSDPKVGHKYEPEVSGSKKHLPKGVSEYTFEDRRFGSFTTQAINQKSAWKKFQKWVDKQLASK